ncbi:MAG: 16S rRNA (guanine(966)-N(2))-methyltransferase RsmD [Moorellales bacterium]
MRITGGTAKGLSIKGPADPRTRPTAARVRQAVFDILGGAIEGTSFLDLFAGSGSVGLEALSRGASRVLFVESHPANAAVVRVNLRDTGFQSKATVWCLDVRLALRRLVRRGERFQFVFADPPYGQGWLKVLGEALSEAILADEGSLLVQASTHDSAGETLSGLLLQREYRYGDTRLLLYRHG